MQRVHRKGSQVLSECYKVADSATLARAHVHRFICSENRENRGLPSLGDLCREFIAKDHKGSRVVSECCKVGYPATLARAHLHRLICSENRGLPSLGDLCREVI